MSTDQLLVPNERGPVAGELQASLLTSAAELAALRDDWNAVAGEVPFRRWEWLEAWWRHFAQPGQNLAVVVVRDPQGQVAGLAPWFCQRSFLGGRTLCLLGSGVVCSDYLSLLCAPGRKRDVVEAVVAWLTGPGAGTWDALEFEAVRRDDPTLLALVERLATLGHPTDRRPTLNSWRLDLPASIEKLVGGLSTSRRAMLRRLIRRQLDTQRSVLRWVRSPTELGPAVGLLVKLHQRRRRSLGQPGCFSSPRFTRFLHEVAGRFEALGRLRLEWIEIEGRPAAVEFNLAGGDTIYCYQRGLDPDLAREQPGWLSTLAIVRRAIAEGFQAYDFLRGDEPYKADWGAERVPLDDVRVVARHPAARLRCLAWRVKGELKTQVKAALYGTAHRRRALVDRFRARCRWASPPGVELPAERTTNAPQPSGADEPAREGHIRETSAQGRSEPVEPIATA